MMFMTILDETLGKRIIINVNQIVSIVNKNTAFEVKMANGESIKINKADGDKLFNKIGARL